MTQTKLLFGILLLTAICFAQIDPATLKWTREGLSLPRGNLASVAIGSKVLFAGGNDWVQIPDNWWNHYMNIDYARVDIYDTATKKLEAGDYLSLRRYGLAAVTCGRFAFFAGGSHIVDPAWRVPYFDTSVSVANVDIYDSRSGNWTTKKLSQPRTSLGAVCLGNKVFFAGGSLGRDNGSSAVVDVFNIDRFEWEKPMQLSSPRNIVATAAGGVAFFVGSAASWRTPQPDIDFYDSRNGRWGTANFSANTTPRALTVPVSIGTKAFFVGGANWDGKWVKTIAVYNTANAQWSEVDLPDTLPPADPLNTVGVIGNYIVIAGNSKTVAYFFYDTVKDVWTTTKKHGAYHHWVGTAATSGKSVYFAGGAPGWSTCCAGAPFIDIVSFP